MISFVDNKTVWAHDFDRQVNNLSAGYAKHLLSITMPLKSPRLLTTRRPIPLLQELSYKPLPIKVLLSTSQGDPNLTCLKPDMK